MALLGSCAKKAKCNAAVRLPITRVVKYDFKFMVFINRTSKMSFDCMCDAAREDNQIIFDHNVIKFKYYAVILNIQKHTELGM